MRMNFVRRYWRECFVAALILANIFVWLAVYERKDGKILSVYFLDVGQGDAIFIESPSKGRMLIDGGRNRQVLSELGKIMPFSDKRIDVVMATHPDADHIGGLPEVVARYDIGVFVEPGVESDNEIDNTLDERLLEKGAQSLLARDGMIIDLGGGARFSVFFPNSDVSNWETNRASIVGELVYGESEFLFTGDSPVQIENILADLYEKEVDSDVLKVGHHGSRTSTSLRFVEAVSPDYAVISAGEGNSYGHPHKEVLNILNQAGSEILGTYEEGTIKFETDGKTLRLE